MPEYGEDEEDDDGGIFDIKRCVNPFSSGSFLSAFAWCCLPCLPAGPPFTGCHWMSAPCLHTTTSQRQCRPTLHCYTGCRPT